MRVDRQKRRQARQEYIQRLGRRLRERREAKGQKLRKLARQVSLDASHLFKIEQGQRPIPLHTVPRLCWELSIDPVSLLEDMVAAEVPVRRRSEARREFLWALLGSDRLKHVHYSEKRLAEILPFFNAKVTSDNYIAETYLKLTLPIEGVSPGGWHSHLAKEYQDKQVTHILNFSKRNATYEDIKAFQGYVRCALAGLLLFTPGRSAPTLEELRVPNKIIRALAQTGFDLEGFLREHPDTAVVLIKTLLDHIESGHLRDDDIAEEWGGYLFEIGYPHLSQAPALIVGHLTYLINEGQITLGVRWDGESNCLQLAPFWQHTDTGAWFYLSQFLQSPNWQEKLGKCALPECGDFVIRRAKEHRFCSRQCKDKARNKWTA